MPKKGRRRQRHEIGIGSEAIRQHDREQALVEEYNAARDAYNNRPDRPSYLSEFPSFDKIQNGDFRIGEPDEYGNNVWMRSPLDCKYRLIVPVENMHPTYVGILRRLLVKDATLTFAQYKEYVKARYAVDDELLDLFVDKTTTDKNGNGTTIEEDNKSLHCNGHPNQERANA